MSMREDLRTLLELLQEMVRNDGTAYCFQVLASFGDSYWAAKVLAELRAGQTPSDILDEFDDGQVRLAYSALQDFLLLFVQVLVTFGKVLTSTLTSIASRTKETD